MKLNSIVSQFRLIHTTILCVRFCLVNIGKHYNARLINKTSRKSYFQFVKQCSNVMSAEYICDPQEIYMEVRLTQTLFVTENMELCRAAQQARVNGFVFLVWMGTTYNRVFKYLCNNLLQYHKRGEVFQCTHTERIAPRTNINNDNPHFGRKIRSYQWSAIEYCDVSSIIIFFYLFLVWIWTRKVLQEFPSMN